MRIDGGEPGANKKPRERFADFHFVGPIAPGGATIKPDSRVNEQIRGVREVLLIDKEGEQIGVVSFDEAMRRAQSVQLDLVEVAPEAKPPVCRIIDYKKVLYEQKRRMKAARVKTHTTELKEIKMRVTIDPHDRDVKLRKAREFLEQGDKVKFTLQYRGREITRPQLGEALVKAIVAGLLDIGELDSPPSRQDKFVHLIMSRRKDWKPGKTAATAAEPAKPTA